MNLNFTINTNEMLFVVQLTSCSFLNHPVKGLLVVDSGRGRLGQVVVGGDARIEDRV